MKNRLSHQEFRISKLLVLGYKRIQICRILDIGSETLRTHEAYIKAKTNFDVQTLWMLFLNKNKKHWPLEESWKNPKIIIPIGVLDVDRFDIHISVEKAFKSLGKN